jgi:hypothetical protein
MLSWSEALGAEGYVVERAVGADGPYEALTSLDAEARAYVDASAPDGQVYYRVRATNAVGSTASNTVTYPPAVGTDLAVTQEDGFDEVYTGALHDYVITVTRTGGASTRVAAQFDSSLPSQLLDATWICDTQGESTCQAQGEGAAGFDAELGVDDPLFITVTGTVGASNDEPMVHSVSISAPPDDPNTENNTNTDTNTIITAVQPEFRDGFEDTVLPQKIVARDSDAVALPAADLDVLSKVRQLRPLPLLHWHPGNGAHEFLVHARNPHGDLQLRVALRSADDTWRWSKWVTVTERNITLRRMEEQGELTGVKLVGPNGQPLVTLQLGAAYR